MLKMLSEGEAEYHYHLVDINPNFSSINKEDAYYTYYLVYILLMMTIPKKMRSSWNKTDINSSNTHLFANIIRDITFDEQDRNDFSLIFALIALIVANSNPENTKDCFNESILISMKHYAELVKKFNQNILSELKSDKKNNIENLQFYIEEVKKREKILASPDLLQKEYMEIISSEKAFIASEPKEEQEQLLHELNLFTLENYKCLLKNEIEEGKEIIQKIQNKREKLHHEILGENDYELYKYYQFGLELNKKIAMLLSQKLSMEELFEKLLEKVENYLIKKTDDKLNEKLSFINKIRENCLKSYQI